MSSIDPVSLDPMSLELAPLDVGPRLDKLRSTFDDVEIDALLVTSLENIRYLTGFSGSAGLLAVTTGGALFVSDGRYRDQAATELQRSGVDIDIEISAGAQREIVSDRLSGLGRIGLEADSVSWSRQQAFAADWFSEASTVATQALVEKLRAVKDAGEVDRIHAAARITDDALAAVRSQLDASVTERDVSFALESEMRRLGAQGPAYETIVASGPNAALPHASPSDRVIGSGDLVVIDVGAVVDGYRSDMTRTICVGDPTTVQARMMSVVDDAQRLAVAAVSAGVPARTIDLVAREHIADAGFGDAFTHGTGHGVGLEIHEMPGINARSDDTLLAGHVITVEPGVYLRDHGGVRVEDTVVVTEDGSRTLTGSTKRTRV